MRGVERGTRFVQNEGIVYTTTGAIHASHALLGAFPFGLIHSG